MNVLWTNIPDIRWHSFQNYYMLDGCFTARSGGGWSGLARQIVQTAQPISSTSDCELFLGWINQESSHVEMFRCKGQNQSTLVIMPLHVTIFASILVPVSCSCETMLFSRLSRCSALESSCFTKVSNPRDRSAPS